MDSADTRKGKAVYCFTGKEVSGIGIRCVKEIVGIQRIHLPKTPSVRGCISLYCSPKKSGQKLQNLSLQEQQGGKLPAGISFVTGATLSGKLVRGRLLTAKMKQEVMRYGK